MALIPTSALTSSGEDLSIPDNDFLAPIIPQPDRPATQTGEIMTDQTSLTIRFITDSNAMEICMDMMEPIPTPNEPGNILLILQPDGESYAAL